ncbi:MAG: endonuclease/exonuclease/phosphatase family protein [Opitutaceae bacterium]|jgi:endonuclease/exonuclease/phosphatase family metal-dependent hydrolase|nr:endonuclease/exonuclease/phosphatase family protein [Opitutaceae bacterium]
MKPLLLFFLTTCFAAVTVTAAATATAAGAVRVVTANLRVPADSDYKTGDGWEQRRKLCRDVLVSLAADIYCFQECRQIQLDYIKQKFPAHEHFAILNSPKPSAIAQPTIAILYNAARFKKTNAGGFYLSGTPEKPSRLPGAAYNRLVNWVLLHDTKTNLPLMVWNTHLDEASAKKGGDALREKQMKLILAAAAGIPDGTPLVLTGDMNATASSSALRAVTAAGWTDTYAALHGPAGPGRTFHGFKGENHPRPGGQIDFIYIKNNLRPVAAEIIKTSKNNKYPSDHYFVTATLEYLPAKN